MSKQDNKPIIDADMVQAMKDELKRQILDEMKDERQRKFEQAQRERELQRKEYEDYVGRMKQSTEPWVDVTGWSQDDKGVKVELEWNDAFVDYLKSNGVTGADDEQIVQKWVTLLLRDMADQMDGDKQQEGGAYL